MNDIDELVRRNGAALRDDVARMVDLEASLSELRALRRRQRRNRVVSAVAIGAAAAAVVAVIGAVASDRDPRTTEPSPALPSPSSYVDCHKSHSVRCLPNGRFRVDASRPYTLHVPEGFEPKLEFVGSALDTYRNDRPSHAGVGITDDVVPARRPGVHLSASQLAHWVATRPYLKPRPGAESINPIRTTVDGLPAWQVQVTTDSAPGNGGGCNDGAQSLCWRLLATPRPGKKPWETGPWPDTVNRYTFVDLPGGATFAIWSWAFDKNWAVMDANEYLIRTLRFVQQ
jgi:hypothetical protein